MQLDSWSSAKTKGQTSRRTELDKNHERTDRAKTAGELKARRTQTKDTKTGEQTDKHREIDKQTGVQRKTQSYIDHIRRRDFVHQ